MAILPTQRRSSEVPLPVPAESAAIPAPIVDHSELTQYLLRLGDLVAAELLGSPLEVDQERAAALRAALQGQHSNDEHLALLDRVVEALRRI